MKSARPLYSVVMPTYNRAHVIGHAIESVLAQTLGDLELVISNGGSTDNTREVVAAFDDPRIKYLESSERLTIGDNYQHGFEATSGEFISFLSDDDAFFPSMLSRVDCAFETAKADVVVFRSCLFYESSEKPSRPGTIHVPRFGGGLRSFSKSDAAAAVMRYFGLEYGPVPDGFNVSYLANAVYRKEVFEKIRRYKKNLFEDTPADVYLALAVALTADNYLCMDEPLHVWTEHENNATATAERKRKDLRSHYERLLGSRQLEHVPIKLALPLNCTCNTLISAVVDAGSPIEPRWDRYYLAIYRSIIDWGLYGVDVSDELNEWKRALSNEPKSIKEIVEGQINSPQFRARDLLISSFPSAYRRMRSMVSKYRGGSEFRGRVKSVNDPCSCARFVEDLKLGTRGT